MCRFLELEKIERKGPVEGGGYPQTTDGDYDLAGPSDSTCCRHLVCEVLQRLNQYIEQTNSCA